MSIRIEIDNKGAYKRTFKKGTIKRAMKRGMNTLGEEMVVYTQKKMDASTKGYSEYHYQGLGWVKSSYPGAYPAVQTGYLKGSVSSRDAGTNIVIFEATAPYAADVEGGNTWRSEFMSTRIAPRPFMSATDAKFSTWKRKKILRNEVSKVWGY